MRLGLGFAILLVALAFAGRADAGVICQEDAPCWNWATMGDHRRGVVTVLGTRAVVSPCRFARMFRTGAIDYRASGTLKGDTLALRLDCPGLAVQTY
jgi:hypothetical protein